jgi:lipid II:glycine glycyltransferase (peptidoglycan interpeptide bridge formation enzyme)
MTSIQQQTVYQVSTFKQETSPVIWQQTLARIPNAHALQSWTWAEFKSRWGWQMLPFTLTTAGNQAEPLAAAMVLKRNIPRLPFSI